MAFYETCLSNYDYLTSDGGFTDGIVISSSGDEHSKAFLEAFRQLDAGPLPAPFYPLNADENTFADGDAIRNLTDKRTKAQEVLGRLPFVDAEDIDWRRQSWSGRRLIIEGGLLIPAERIVSVRSFKDWRTGLNNELNAQRPYSPDALGLGPGSLNAIITYASLSAESQPKNDGPLLVVARDADGEYWGVLDCDGSHRAGAQKLRGDKTIQVARTVVHTDESMPQISYGVRNRFNAF